MTDETGWVEVNLPWRRPGQSEAVDLAYAEVQSRRSQLEMEWRTRNPFYASSLVQGREIHDAICNISETYEEIAPTSDMDEETYVRLSRMAQSASAEERRHIMTVLRYRHARHLLDKHIMEDPEYVRLTEEAGLLHLAEDLKQFRHHEACVPGVIVEVTMPGPDSAVARLLIGDLNTNGADDYDGVRLENCTVLRYFDARDLLEPVLGRRR